MTAAVATVITAELLEEFAAQIDNEKEYTLKELKQILTDIYNVKSGKKKAVAKPKSPKQPKPVSDDSDDDKPKKRGRPAKEKDDKPKKPPSAYNIFVKQTMATLKVEQPEIPAKELMSMAAGKWKELSDDEKAAFKASIA